MCRFIIASESAFRYCGSDGGGVGLVFVVWVKEKAHRKTSFLWGIYVIVVAVCLCLLKFTEYIRQPYQQYVAARFRLLGAVILFFQRTLNCMSHNVPEKPHRAHSFISDVRCVFDFHTYLPQFSIMPTNKVFASTWIMIDIYRKLCNGRSAQCASSFLLSWAR